MKRDLVKDAKRAALSRFEASCRTTYDFENLTKMYDRLDESRERRERRWEILAVEKCSEWKVGFANIIPRPLNHQWWRQMMGGDFIDVIFDCPHEIHELVSSPSFYEMFIKLDENRKEVLYYRAVRGWTPQKLALFRNQTDRNIRKVYDKLVADLRLELYNRLSPRYHADEPLTLVQRQFCADYESGKFNKGAKTDEIK